jgi:hypothetical protein
MRGAAIAVIALALISDAAAQEAPRTNPSTHDIALCLGAADQPICILRTLAAARAQRAYRDDPRFAHARDVLAAIGPVDGQRADEEPGGNDVGVRAARQHQISPPGPSDHEAELHAEAARTVIAALEADRNGVAPDRALAQVRAVGQNPGSNIYLAATARCWAYMEIWKLFEEEDDRRRAGAPRPSEALARASVAACEAELPRVPPSHGSRVSMAQADVMAAYRALGDDAGVERLMQRDERDSDAAGERIRTALSQNNLDEAVAAALAPGERESDGAGLLNLYRGLVIGYARLAGRTEDAARIAEAVLHDAPELTADVLARVGSRRTAVRLIERLDRAGRDTGSEASLQSAHAAVLGWLALGETARARRLVDHWIPTARQEVNAEARLVHTGAPVGCEIEGSHCVRDVVLSMLRATDRLDEAWNAVHLQPSEAVLFDIEDGRGLTRLDAHLSHAQNEWDAEHALMQCVDWAPLDLAAQCARIFIARWRVRPLTGRDAVRIGVPWSADRALQVAEAATKQGELALMQEMLDEALTVLRDGQDVELPPHLIRRLTSIAAMQLHVAGRT